MGRRSKWTLWGGVAVVVVAAALMWFKPWALWVDETVDEALPTSAPTTSAGESAGGEPPSPVPAPAGPTTVAQGGFVSHEHETAGTAKVVRLADGTHTLRIEGLDTSNGPDLRILLSDAAVVEGTAGRHVFDDGRHVTLAKLKGNRGNQNYTLPADIDWSDYTSVSIWCDRFDVSFGAAPLARL
ncbi:DM13 domain-containing protein [Streptomyces sp. NPDC055051]